MPLPIALRSQLAGQELNLRCVSVTVLQTASFGLLDPRQQQGQESNLRRAFWRRTCYHCTTLPNVARAVLSHIPLPTRAAIHALFASWLAALSLSFFCYPLRLPECIFCIPFTLPLGKGALIFRSHIREPPQNIHRRGRLNIKNIPVDRDNVYPLVGS